MGRYVPELERRGRTIAVAARRYCADRRGRGTTVAAAAAAAAVSAVPAAGAAAFCGNCRETGSFVPTRLRGSASGSPQPAGRRARPEISRRDRAGTETSALGRRTGCPGRPHRPRSRHDPDRSGDAEAGGAVHRSGHFHSRRGYFRSVAVERRAARRAIVPRIILLGNPADRLRPSPRRDLARARRRIAGKARVARLILRI